MNNITKLSFVFVLLIAIVSLLPVVSSAAPEDISGTVFEDLNGNGSRDGGEAGISGVTVQMANPLGGSASTTTDSSGDYVFTAPDVVTGTHTIEVIVPGGYTATGPTSLSVDKADGSEAGGNDFGLAPPATPTPTETPTATATAVAPTSTATPTAGLASVWGYTYNDLNGNGSRDSGEPAVGNVSLSIVGGPGGSGSNSNSGSNGYYLFPSLPNGVYSLQVFWSSVNYQATSPDIVPVLINGSDVVIDFGGQPLATLTPSPTTVVNTPTATPTGTRPSRSISFTVDDEEIKEGECVDFEWTVLGDIAEVTFRKNDGSRVTVNPVDERDECPEKDTEYELRVKWLDSTTESRTLKVDVKPKSSSGGSNPAPTATPVPGLGTPVPGGSNSPSLMADPYQGAAGETFAFVASGFTGGEAINIGLAQPDGSVVGLPAQQANSSGSFAFSYNTQAGDQTGLYTMIAEGQSSHLRASIAFFVADAATPTPVAVVINSGPNGLSGGVVSQPQASPTTPSDEQPLLANQDPLLANIQVAALDENAATGASPAALGAEKQQVLPGQGGVK